MAVTKKKPARRAPANRKPSKAAPAKELAEFAADWTLSQRRIHGTYDAARSGNDLDSYWVNADSFDADSANSKDVRHTLIRRSRYEVANNGYSDGISQTYATDLVGVGPMLRMQTASKPFNQLVERTWFLWTQAIKFRRKLWCMAHAKDVDGEALSVMAVNPRVRHPIKLDLSLHEAEQCQTPFLPFDDPNYIDGIKFDAFQNPLWFDFLSEHPGKANGLTYDLKPKRIPAERVLHWFKLRRPGQHRGVPERASTLNIGAAFRRLREANLSTAEKVAAWTLFLKTLFEPETIQAMPPMSNFDILHGMMTTLPNSVEPFQLRAEHPGPTYDTFHKSLLNEQGRPKNMPYNKSACDSSSYNYASGRLDHQTYYGNLDVDREDGNDLVLDPLFEVWFDLAISTFGWLGGSPEAVGPGARFHLWDWPKHLVADVESEANANRTKLESGQVSIPRLKSESGVDAEDDAETEAEYFGVSVDELKRRQLDALYPPASSQAAPPASVSDEAVAAAYRNLIRRGVIPNGNGAHHG